MQRLPRHNILRGRLAFSRVLSQGRTKSRGLVRCFYIPIPKDSQGTTAPRAGFAVGRGIRTASQRNRAKRLMREVYRKHADLLFVQGKSVVSELVLLYLGGGKKELRHSIIENEVLALLKKLQEKD